MAKKNLYREKGNPPKKQYNKNGIKRLKRDKRMQASILCLCVCFCCCCCCCFYAGPIQEKKHLIEMQECGTELNPSTKITLELTL